MKYSLDDKEWIIQWWLNGHMTDLNDKEVWQLSQTFATLNDYKVLNPEEYAKHFTLIKKG